jgi:hypothetical protein
MAIRELFSLVQSTLDIDRTTPVDIHAGQLVAKSTAGLAVLAARNATITASTNAEFVGLAADDAARTSNTFIQADPVGSTKVSADGTTFTANNNAFFASTKRALGDYQDETVSNVSNLTAGSTGYQGPRRGLGVYNYTPGTQFIVDSLCVASAKVSNATTDTTAGSWVPGTLLAIGAYHATAASSHSGKLVEADPASRTTLDYGKPVARLDKMEGTQGADGTLYYITLI